MFEEDIVRGMGLLDENFPDWRERIVLEELDMGSCYDCVLAQASGTSYMFALHELGLRGDDAVPYGFSLGTRFVQGETYERLTEAWQLALQEEQS